MHFIHIFVFFCISLPSDQRLYVMRYEAPVTIHGASRPTPECRESICIWLISSINRVFIHITCWDTRMASTKLRYYKKTKIPYHMDLWLCFILSTFNIATCSESSFCACEVSLRARQNVGGMCLMVETNWGRPQHSDLIWRLCCKWDSITVVVGRKELSKGQCAMVLIFNWLFSCLLYISINGIDLINTYNLMVDAQPFAYRLFNIYIIFCGLWTPYKNLKSLWLHILL